MEIHPIKTDADYEAALQEIESLMTTEPHTPEGDQLEVLVTLVEAYEGLCCMKQLVSKDGLIREHAKTGGGPFLEYDPVP